MVVQSPVHCTSGYPEGVCYIKKGNAAAGAHCFGEESMHGV
jgi:hypothetical protein